jgi:hypothetical protein
MKEVSILSSKLTSRESKLKAIEAILKELIKEMTKK